MKYTPKIERAIQRAVISHDGLYRKETVEGKRLPYVSHLFSVASIVSEYTNNEDTIVAALLHDALEDTALTHEELEKEFGNHVCGLVDSLSENYAYKDNGLSVREQKINYVHKLKNAAPEALLIASADKIHNLESNLRNNKITSRQMPDDFFRFHRAVLNIIENGLGINHPLVLLHRETFKKAEEMLS